MLKRAIALLVLVSFVLVTVGCASPTKPVDSRGVPKLIRIPQRGYVGGVLAGVSYYTGLNVTVLRIGTVVLTLALGAGIGIYVICWIIIPPATEVPANYSERTGD